MNSLSHSIARTPGLEHLLVLRLLDRTGLSAWLLGLGCFLTLTVASIILLILARYPDPDMYRNSIAFCAILSFLIIFYFTMGRGWYQDVLTLLEFDQSLEAELEPMRPNRFWVLGELVLALACALFNYWLTIELPEGASMVLVGTVLFFYFIQYTLIVLSMDVVFRQLFCMIGISRRIRIDLLRSELYSTLANVMVRNVGLYIFGVCIIALSYIVFTEGSLGFSEMLVLMMPWYLPGMIIISLYLLPYNIFRKRMRSRKQQELNCITAALHGNMKALEHSLLNHEKEPSVIDLLYYQERIQAIKEWPFTDRIRALVLFGILPPMTWVIAALIEIYIEASL